MDDDNVVPELLAYHHRGRYKAWCSWCDRWHHWPSLGLVSGKCSVYTPNAAHVVLIDAGRWVSPKVVKYSNRKL